MRSRLGFLLMSWPNEKGRPQAPFEKKQFKRNLLLGDFGTGSFPTRNPCGKMLHVFVSEFGGGFGSTLIGTASGAAAISDYKGVLVLGQVLGQILAIRREGNCGRNMSLFVSSGAIDVDYGDLAVFDGLLKFLDADIGKLTGKQCGGEEGKSD